jgi:hypothetical protein
MNTKIIAPVVGVLLLGSSAVVLADERWHDRGWAREYRGWHDQGWHGRPEWFERHDHRGYYDGRRWCPPRGPGYWGPRTAWHPDYRYGYPARHWGGPAYDRDGVTVILRGDFH